MQRLVSEFTRLGSKSQPRPRSDLDRVFTAWQNTQPRARPLTRRGDEFFYFRFQRALEDAQTGDMGLEQVLKIAGGEFAPKIEPIDDYRHCTDPGLLLRILVGEYSSTILSRPQHLFDIQRKLTLALQILYLAVHDPQVKISADLTRINLQASTGFFDQDGVMLEVGFALKDDGIVKGIPQISEEAGVVFTWPTGTLGQQQTYSCRTVIDKANSITYFIYCASRPKGRMAAVIKLERSIGNGRGSIRDQRGVRHVVVAVKSNTNQGIRLATWDDAINFGALAAKRFWVGNLVHSPAVGRGRNPFTNEQYRDLRLRGFWHRTEGEVLYRAPVEQQIMIVTDYLNSVHGDGTLGHLGYRKQFLRQAIFPQWFPEKLYGISWKDLSS